MFFIRNRDDMEMMLNKIVPEGLPYRHSCEGPDDMVRIFSIFFFKSQKRNAHNDFIYPSNIYEEKNFNDIFLL